MSSANTVLVWISDELLKLKPNWYRNIWQEAQLRRGTARRFMSAKSRQLQHNFTTRNTADANRSSA